MKTKIVYTVVGGDCDIYLPQTMVAAYTARKYNPAANIIVVTDYATSSVINAKLPAIKDYINDVVVVDVPTELNNMQRSRYLKTTLRQHIKGDFLYIDTDTVVTRELSEVDNLNVEIGAVLDRHTQIGEHTFYKKIENDISIVGLSISNLRNCYYNGGVIYVKDTPLTHKLYDLWHKYWNESRKQGKSIDQPALAKANIDCNYPIQELSGIWNCQLSDNFVNYLANAKILHYFASGNSSPFLLYDNDIFKSILEKEQIPDALILSLEKSKEFFVKNHLIVYGEDMWFYRTYLHTIFKYHKKAFRIFEYFARVLITKRLW